MVLLVTDGRPTTGVMDSASIIEQFSSQNKGRISVFANGTTKAANRYLLDLLSYRNKGDAYVVQRGRWDIPDSISMRMQEVSRPVLTDLRLFVSASSRAEVYPGVLAISTGPQARPDGEVRPRVAACGISSCGSIGGGPCDMAFEIEYEYGGERIQGST